MDPPEPPEPIVNFGSPKRSMKRSLIIISVSAETRSLHPVPRVLRVPNATANPRLSGVCCNALVAVLVPERYPGPQPPPKGTVSLPFQPGPGFLPPGDQGLAIGLAGSSMSAMR